MMVTPSSQPGGAEEILFRLLPELPRRGVDPVVVLMEEGFLAARLRRAGIPFEMIPGGDVADGAALAASQAAVARLLESHAIDVCYSNMAKAHVVVADAARAAGRPAFWTQMDMPDAPPTWMYDLASSLPAACVLTLSRDAAVRQRARPRTPAVVVWHPGTDADRFRPNGAAGDARSWLGGARDDVLVAIAGRLEAWKGHELFLRAAELVLAENDRCSFAIVGGEVPGHESYAAFLVELAERLGVAGRVRFAGFQPRMEKVWPAVDIAVNASAAEPFGMVVIEAMACGVPVVAARAGGPADAVVDGETGVLVDSLTPESLAAAITDLAADAGQRGAFSRRARRRVLDRFTVGRMAADFAAIARRVASGAPFDDVG